MTFQSALIILLLFLNIQAGEKNFLSFRLPYLGIQIFKKLLLLYGKNSQTIEISLGKLMIHNKFRLKYWISKFQVHAVWCFASLKMGWFMVLEGLLQVTDHKMDF